MANKELLVLPDTTKLQIYIYIQKFYITYLLVNKSYFAL